MSTLYYLPIDIVLPGAPLTTSGGPLTIEAAWPDVLGTISVSVALGSGTGTLGGTLTQTADGLDAYFDDLTIDTAGVFTLVFSADGFDSRETEPFHVGYAVVADLASGTLEGVAGDDPQTAAATDPNVVLVAEPYSSTSADLGYMAFDTSGLGAGATISNATLMLNAWPHLAFTSGGDGTETLGIEVRLYEWGTTLTEGDWVPRSGIAALPLLAHGTVPGFDYDTYPDFGVPQTLDLTSDALAANIDPTGMTRMLVHTPGYRTGTKAYPGPDPVGPSAILGTVIGSFHGYPFDDVRPYLIIEYTTSSGPGPRSQSVVIA